MSGNIVVYLEQRGGALKRSSLEALAEARRLAPALGGRVTAVVAGSGVAAASAAAAAAGADEVLVFDRPDLASYGTENHRAAVVAAARSASADVVLLSATTQGRDLAAAVAGALDAGYAADCTALRVEGGRLVATRPVYAGKAVLTAACRAAPFVLSLRPNVFSADGPPVAAPGRIAAGASDPVPPSLGSVVTAIAEAAQGKKDVAEADIVVSGGRGIGGPEGFKPLEELAEVLGAAVGASRAVVDLGWRPHADQVGQTGKVVSPKLYIACGISGAIQHLAGMRTSKVIVAINKDAEAPIFKVATYGIVGDVLQIVPALTQALKAALGR